MTDKTGTVVVYLDELHRPHYALITNDFNKQSIGPVNLIYVNPEASMEDDYGRQMKRATSVGFWGDGYTELLANCWMLLGDYTNIKTGIHGEKSKHAINGDVVERVMVPLQ